MAKICLFCADDYSGTAEPWPGVTSARAQEAKITVNAASDSATPSDPLLFGQNVLFAGNSLWNSRLNGLDPAVKPLIEALTPTLVRFPGGSAADQYLWEDGLGFMTLEPVTPTSAAADAGRRPDGQASSRRASSTTNGGQFGEPFSFLRLNGNRLEGLLGLKGLHPAGVSVRPEARPGQPDWFSNSYGIAEHLKLVQGPRGPGDFHRQLQHRPGPGREAVHPASLSQRVKRAAALVAFVNGDLNNTAAPGH